MNNAKFGTLTYARDIPTYLDWCRAAESFGFDFLGYGDSPTLWMDPYVILALAAQVTQRVRLGITVTNPVTRHPAVAASALATLQHLSDGRVFCGVGGGDSAIYNSQLKPAPLSKIEAYVRTLQGLTGGAEAAYEGARIKFQWQPRRVPVWMSAEGPKTLDLAGRIADGVIIGCGITEDVVKDSIARIAAGARAAGRDPDTIEKWWNVRIHFAHSEAEGWEQLRFIHASCANKHFRFTLEDKFVPEQYREPVRLLQRDYAFHEHADFTRPGHNAQLVEKYGLTEFLGRRFSITGPAAQMVERLRQIMSWGASNLSVIQLYDDRVGYMRRLANEIFPEVM